MLKAGFRQGDHAPMAYIELVGACGEADFRYRTLLKAEAGRRLMAESNKVALDDAETSASGAYQTRKQQHAIARTEKQRQRVLVAQKMSETDWEQALSAEMAHLQIRQNLANTQAEQ